MLCDALWICHSSLISNPRLRNNNDSCWQLVLTSDYSSQFGDRGCAFSNREVTHQVGKANQLQNYQPTANLQQQGIWWGHSQQQSTIHYLKWLLVSQVEALIVLVGPSYQLIWLQVVEHSFHLMRLSVLLAILKLCFTGWFHVSLWIMAISGW